MYHFKSIFQKHPWQENDIKVMTHDWVGSHSLDFDLVQLVERFNKPVASRSSLFLATVKETSDGSSSSWTRPNQPSVVSALEKLSFRDDVPQQASTIHQHPHHTPAITGRSNPPPADTIMATCHAASARKHFTRNGVQNRFRSPFFLFFSKSSVKPDESVMCV